MGLSVKHLLAIALLCLCGCPPRECVKNCQEEDFIRSKLPAMPRWPTCRRDERPSNGYCAGLYDAW